MRDKMKKTLGFMLATVCVGAMFAGCGGGTMAYKGDNVNDYVSSASVASNGGFAVEKGDFIYFINGKEAETATNEYGDVVKGALMRISKADLAAGNYANVKMIVPSVLTAKDYDAGIFIYGDYVYYATPTTDRTDKGETANSHIDFKRARLDGKEGAMKDYFLRLSDNTSTYRFVMQNNTVYCLYKEGGALKSVNTETKEITTLVKGAESEFFFDAKNPENPYVYYTMTVTPEGGSAEKYNQIYRVNAAATAKADSANAKYTAYDETGAKIKEYAFNKADLEEQNATAVENGGSATYDFSDYTTYPYVNLGELVLDGVGSASYLYPTQYNWESDRTKCDNEEGYKYTLSTDCYQDGKLYFTRAKQGTSTGSDSANPYRLYYVTDATTNGADWNVIGGNKTVVNTIASTNSTATTATSLFYADGGKEYYIYVADGTLYREGYDNEAKKDIEKVALANGVGTATLMQLDETNKYLYFYKDSGNGSGLSRLQYDGTADDYNTLIREEEYEIVTLDYLVFESDWYKPEIFGDTVLYANAQTFGESTYEYVFAAKMGSVAEIEEANKKYDDVQEYITKSTNPSDLQKAMQYYYRTGETAAFDEYRETTQYSASKIEAFDTFVGLFAEGKQFHGMLEKDLTAQVGKTKEEDAEAIEESWKNTLNKVTEEEEEEDTSLPTWAILLIVFGSLAVVVAVIVAIAIAGNKKKKRKIEAAATVNAYKRKKIDTTDDKSIDVYADEIEEEAEATEETEEVEEVEMVEEVEEVSEEEVVEAEVEATEESAEKDE